MRVAEGVFLLAGPPINDEGQAFLVKAECPFLVDSGAFGEMALQNLLMYEVRPEELEALINTHAHADRAGGDWLFHSLGVTVAAGERDAYAIQKGDPIYTASKVIGVEFKPCPVGWVLRGDAEVCGAEVLWLPGHTAGSLGVYYEGVLLAGDLLGPLSKDWGSDEGAWRRSLERALSLEPEVMCANNVCFYGREKVKAVLEKSLELGPPWLS
ncbi:MBL fold metallo-hydrolase [Ignicoccus hospitalis]|uniref:MBL fold metallo-hydrolase n=1 Tax=Ignicoccus hospitalis TaxID=160233 RepID=UPI000698455D|nr:MBL fold metallo-hydrolase [Ignicoccus hospitalis]HIH89768.1 MBL fold metallo-hydrolase [Desulfurococcaceae archaeon]